MPTSDMVGRGEHLDIDGALAGADGEEAGVEPARVGEQRAAARRERFAQGPFLRLEGV